MKAITTKYSNYRYTAKDSDRNRVVVHQDDALTGDQNHDAAAVALCRKMRWNGPLMGGDLKPGERVYVFDTDDARVQFERTATVQPVARTLRTLYRGQCVDCGKDLWLDPSNGTSNFLDTTNDSPKRCEDCTK